MREILERCVELDRTAYEVYRGMAAACENESLASLFTALSKEELQHVDWWTDLLAAWESGLVPDIADEHAVIAELDDVMLFAKETVPPQFDSMSVDQMLEAAAHLEFFMLNPVFGELADVMGPASHVDRREAYARHVSRLVKAIEDHHSDRGPATFLARMLLRSYRDQQRYVEMSVQDQLTGLYNRRGVLGHLRHWLSWSGRYVRPVSVVLIDVDRFKEVNDNHGHLVGDEILRQVGIALKRGARGSDVIGRFGGDEFMILAPETGGPDLSVLMERVLTRVREVSVQVDGEDISVSVSVGGAWVCGGTTVEIETFIAAADRSLYDAKEHGRDRAAEPRQAFALA